MVKKKGGKKGKKSGKGKSSAKSIKSAISDHAKEMELDSSSKDFWNRQVIIFPDFTFSYKLALPENPYKIDMQLL